MKLKKINKTDSSNGSRRIKNAPHHERIIKLLFALSLLPLTILAQPRQKKTPASVTTKLTSSIENVITSTVEFIASVSPGFITTNTIKKIVFDNVITEKMITFTGHWAQPYPSTFSVTVNDQPFIGLNRRGKIDVKAKEFEVSKDNTLTVVYEWALDKFGKRWHHEKKEVTFKVPEKPEPLNMTFGFDCDSRVQIPQAKLITNNQLISKTNA